MRKLALSFCIVISSGVLAACGSTPGKATPRPASDQVGTIVAATMEAFLSATPVPSLTPVPSSTPSETATLAAPAGWVVYTNEQYGFELAHPNLYDCKDQCGLSAFIRPDGVQSVTTLAVESTLMWGTDAPFDGLSLDVFPNPDAIPLQDFVEQEKQAILTGPSAIGPPLGVTPYLAGGQTGIKMSLAGNMDAIYIPFPNSHQILIFSIGQQHEGSFDATAEQIISTLRFTK
jgi:hypothetical protein